MVPSSFAVLGLPSAVFYYYITIILLLFTIISSFAIIFLPPGAESLRDASHRFLSKIFNPINQFKETQLEFYTAHAGHLREAEGAITSFARMRHPIHGRLVRKLVSRDQRH